MIAEVDRERLLSGKTPVTEPNPSAGNPVTNGCRGRKAVEEAMWTASHSPATRLRNENTAPQHPRLNNRRWCMKPTDHEIGKQPVEDGFVVVSALAQQQEVMARFWHLCIWERRTKCS